MADVQPNLTNTGTLRPKQKPLLKTGDAFIPIDVPDFPSEVILPLGITSLNALGIFKLFLPNPILDCIVENTNNSEGRAHRPWKPNARANNWILMTRKELKSYITIIIYTGLYIKQKLETYWSTDPDSPYYIIPCYISLRRFQLLHRRLRIRCLANSKEVLDL
jgi:hypothetical protein